MNNLINKASSYFNKVAHMKENVPPNVNRALDQIGDEQIISARCGRTPVQAVVQGALRTISNVPYDNLFHLFIELTLPSGKWVLEKIERINLVKEDRSNKQGAEFTASFPVNKTVNELFQNTQNHMGARFLPYQSNSNNCQVFIMGVLDGNGLNNSELTSFVKQDTRSIFKGNPALRKLANTLTDLGGYFNAALQGGQTKGHRTSDTGAQSSLRQCHVGHSQGTKHLSNELTNFEITDLMRHYRLPFNGCYIKDKLPIRLKNGSYIINLNGHSHWTALIKNGPDFYYFDSFGFPAPTEVEQKAADIVWSDVDIQAIMSSSCGWYCIAWIRFLNGKKNKKKAYADFLKLFSPKHLMNNEKILGGLLR